jgi:hypothetical protein
MEYRERSKRYPNYYCPHAGQAFTFLLDQKSKQKNQEKIIPAFTHKALRLAAIFSGPRALDYGLFKASLYKFSLENPV